jgi:hypothetical protein
MNILSVVCCFSLSLKHDVGLGVSAISALGHSEGCQILFGFQIGALRFRWGEGGWESCTQVPHFCDFLLALSRGFLKIMFRSRFDDWLPKHKQEEGKNRVRRRPNRVRTVALKTTHGKYVVAEKNGQMNANRRWLRAWEKFKMITHKDGTISLKSAHGKYVASGAHL